MSQAGLADVGSQRHTPSDILITPLSCTLEIPKLLRVVFAFPRVYVECSVLPEQLPSKISSDQKEERRKMPLNGMTNIVLINKLLCCTDFVSENEIAG